MIPSSRPRGAGSLQTRCRAPASRSLFEGMRILGDEVVGVKSREIVAPFVSLILEEWPNENGKV